MLVFPPIHDLPQRDPTNAFPAIKVRLPLVVNAISLQALSVFLGYGFGLMLTHSESFRVVLSAVSALTVLSVVLLLSGFLSCFLLPRRMSSGTPWAYAGFLTYALAYMLANPFTDGRFGELIVGIALVTPLLFAIAYFVRRRWWPEILAYSVVLLEAVVVLTYNANSASSGVSFFWGGWLA